MWLPTYKGESYNIINDTEQLSVYDYFDSDYITKDLKLGIENYRSFHVLPAVRRIDWRINHNFENKEEVYLTNKFHYLLSFLKGKYEFIFIDSRAGYDILNSIIHNASDATICVQEEDDISFITAQNLIRQFETESNKPVLTLINKARNTNDSYDLLIKNKGYGSRVSHLGSIPFDIDVMNSFGEPDFWDKIKRTLYYNGVAEVLLKIEKKFSLGFNLILETIRPIPSIVIEKRLAFLGLRERTLLIFGLSLTLGGLFVSFYGLHYIYKMLYYEPERIIGAFFSLLGFVLIMIVLFKSVKPSSHYRR